MATYNKDGTEKATNVAEANAVKQQNQQTNPTQTAQVQTTAQPTRQTNTNQNADGATRLATDVVNPKTPSVGTSATKDGQPIGDGTTSIAKDVANPSPIKSTKPANPIDYALSDHDSKYITDAGDRQSLMNAKMAYDESLDTAGKLAANEQAERIRAKYGYIGGPDGSNYYQLNDMDNGKITDPDDMYEILNAKRAWEAANQRGDKAGMKQAADIADAIRRKYGYTTVGGDGTSGYVDLTQHGLLTEQDTKQQYIVTPSGDVVRASNSPVTIVDANGREIVLKDANGKPLSSSDLVFGADDRTYLKSTGQTLGEIAKEYDITNANVRFFINGRYYSVDGRDVTGEMGSVAPKPLTDNENYNQFYNDMKKYGIELTPYISDYDTLTREQALAQATEQLGSKYDLALQDTLSNMDKKAIQTGYYGQLPAEALRQQAAASTELQRQTAINELARELLADDRSYAQQQFEDDTASVQKQLQAIYQAYQYLYALDQDKIKNDQSQQQINQNQQQIDQNYETNKAQLLLNAAEAIAQARKNGVSYDELTAAYQKMLDAYNKGK